MRDEHSIGDSGELAALYAAGALPSEERVLFEAHLATGCTVCNDELQRLHPVLAAFAAASTPAPPDPRTREALLKRVAAASEAHQASPLQRHWQSAEQANTPRPEMFIQRVEEGIWEKSDVPGVSIRTLFVDQAKNQFTALVRMAPGSSYPRHVHNGPEECLVLEGELHVGDTVLRQGDYQRAPAGSRHGIQSTEHGCLLLIMSSLSDSFE